MNPSLPGWSRCCIHEYVLSGSQLWRKRQTNVGWLKYPYYLKKSLKQNSIQRFVLKVPLKLQKFVDCSKDILKPGRDSVVSDKCLSKKKFAELIT